MSEGIYREMTIGDYVADPAPSPSLSASVASILVNRSPAHARLAHPRLTPAREQRFSAAANFGSAIHALVFGGQSIVPIDADDYKTKLAKECRDDALRRGAIPLVRGEMERAERLAHAARLALNAVQGRAVNMVREATCLWQDGGIWMRCRPDEMSERMEYLIDLKITGTPANQCNRQFFSQGYDMQAAMMERAADHFFPSGKGRRAIRYLFIEDEPPFAHAVLDVTEGTLMIARRKLETAMRLWHTALKENTWPAYPETFIPSHRPAWDEINWLVRELEGQA